MHLFCLFISIAVQASLTLGNRFDAYKLNHQNIVFDSSKFALKMKLAVYILALAATCYASSLAYDATKFNEMLQQYKVGPVDAATQPQLPAPIVASQPSTSGSVATGAARVSGAPFASLKNAVHATASRMKVSDAGAPQTLFAYNYDSGHLAHHMANGVTYEGTATDKYVYPAPLVSRDPWDVADEVFAASFAGVAQTYQDGYDDGIADADDDAPDSPAVEEGQYLSGYLSGYGARVAQRRRERGHGGGGNNGNGGCGGGDKCPAVVPPIHKVSNFTMFPRSGVFTGRFDYPTASKSLPFRMVVNKDTQQCTIDHTTTQHQFTPSSGTAISLLPAPGVVLSFRTTDTFPNLAKWILNYQDFWTNDEIFVFRGRKVKKYMGKVFDHHSYNKKISVTMYMVVAGRDKGMVAYWQFAMPYPCDEQLFEWIPTCAKFGTPAPSEFLPPVFLPVPIANLTNYGNFPANWPCQPIPQPPLP